MSQERVINEILNSRDDEQFTSAPGLRTAASVFDEAPLHDPVRPLHHTGPVFSDTFSRGGYAINQEQLYSN